MDNENLIQEALQTENQQSKFLPKEEVTDIVRNAHSRGYAKAEREYQAKLVELEERLRQNNAPTANTQQINVDEISERVRKDVRQEHEALQAQIAQQQSEQHERALAQKYLSNMRMGNKIYDDFDEKIKDFDPREFQGVAMMAAELDGQDTPDAIYNLLEKPEKMADLELLFKTSPALARKRFNQLVMKIRENRKGVEEGKSLPGAPLSKVKPSISGSGNDKMPTIDQMKKDSRFYF